VILNSIIIQNSGQKLEEGMKMKLTEAIAQRVKFLLEDRGFSQYALFKLGGVPRSTVSDVVNNKKKRVSTETVYQICATLNITLQEFFNDPMFDNIDD
jgi:transcriptional regulator with XRE-family HTH domain